LAGAAVILGALRSGLLSAQACRDMPIASDATTMAAKLLCARMDALLN
jgi:hypothetical protein